MSSGYGLDPEAYADLDDIRGYIAQDSPDAADRVMSEIFDAIRGLVPFPHQGHRRPDLRSSTSAVHPCTGILDRAKSRAHIGIYPEATVVEACITQ